MTTTRDMSDYLVNDPSEAVLTSAVLDIDDPPLVSFCIPTLNDAETIRRAIESWRTQNYPSIEIVVVDGGSTDGTVDIAERSADNVLFDDGTLGSARQTGLEAASGGIIALLDGDIILPHENWLRSAVKRFGYSERVSTVWPQNVAPPDAPLLTRLYFNHWDLIIEDRIAHDRGYFGGGNSLFRRRHLEEIGGISTSHHWGEDFDWAKKLHDAGYQTVYHRDPVYHDTMGSFGQFVRKQFVGAEAFSSSGFQLMGLTMRDVIREQFLLGSKGMLQGLLSDHDPAWLLYPPYIVSRSLAYGITNIKRVLDEE